MNNTSHTDLPPWTKHLTQIAISHRSATLELYTSMNNTSHTDLPPWSSIHPWTIHLTQICHPGALYIHEQYISRDFAPPPPPGQNISHRFATLNKTSHRFATLNKASHTDLTYHTDMPSWTIHLTDLPRWTKYHTQICHSATSNTDLTYLMLIILSSFVKIAKWNSRTAASVNLDSQWSRQDACFASANLLCG